MGGGPQESWEVMRPKYSGKLYFRCIKVVSNRFNMICTHQAHSRERGSYIKTNFECFEPKKWRCLGNKWQVIECAWCPHILKTFCISGIISYEYPTLILDPHNIIGGLCEKRGINDPPILPPWGVPKMKIKSELEPNQKNKKFFFHFFKKKIYRNVQNNIINKCS